MTPYYDRDGITIYCGDSSSIMRNILPDNHIDLTVTSPPYDLVDEDMITHSGKGLRDYQGYEWDFVSIAKQLYRVTVTGGVVVWVVGDATVNGSETGSSFRQALYFKDVGFRLHDTMIYSRQGPPSVAILQGRYEQNFEYMFILSKGLPDTCNYIKIPKSYKDNRTEDTGQRLRNGKKSIAYRSKSLSKIKGNIWIYKIGGGHITNDKQAYQHPAIFPEALARDHIISWSNPGNLILDPFLGSGTTLKMAQQLGRRAIGFEISEEYCAIAVDRLRQPSFFSIPDRPKDQPAEQLSLISRGDE